MISQGKILFTKQDETYVMKFLGDVRVTIGPAISNFIPHIGTCRNYKSMVVDLTETTAIDSTSLGMLGKIHTFLEKLVLIRTATIKNNIAFLRNAMIVTIDELHRHSNCIRHHFWQCLRVVAVT